MEILNIANFLQALMGVLLVACLIYMYSINKKLKMLRSGGDGFKAVVMELNHATDNAQNAIQGLKLTVRDAEHGLVGNLKQARSVTEELKYLLEQASLHSGGLSGGNLHNIPPISDNLRNVPPPIVAQNRAKNFADQTLEKVAKKKQSLPNPIIHNQQNTANLGRNLPAEHKQIALERREQALNAIEAKRRQSNSGVAMAERQIQPSLQKNARHNTGQMGRVRSSNKSFSLNEMAGRYSENENRELAKNKNITRQRMGNQPTPKTKKSMFDRLNKTR